MTDNYAKTIARICLFICFGACFAIGLVTGYMYIKIDEKLHEIQQQNMMIIYGVRK